MELNELLNEIEEFIKEKQEIIELDGAVNTLKSTLLLLKSGEVKMPKKKDAVKDEEFDEDELDDELDDESDDLDE